MKMYATDIETDSLDLTKGKIMPQLINFTIPLIIGNIFQLTYNAVDSIIVGCWNC